MSGRVVPLGNGRALGIFECGDPDGVPLLYFHGFPGSRLEARFLAAAAGAGVRLIGVDRPGMGLSPPVAGRQIVDWPSDVARLGDALHLTRFGVVGYSGGAPYAAACAWRIPERLIGCGIVSGAGRVSPVLSMLAATVSRPAMAVVGPFVREAAGARRWVRRNRRLAAPADRQCLARPDVEATVVSSLVEAFRQGSAGPAHEAKLLSRPWGFALEDITIPTHLWHGERDRIVPARTGRATAQRIRDCRAVFLDGEGHFSVIVAHGVDIVRRSIGR